MRENDQEQFTEWFRRHRARVRRIAVLTGAGISAESGLPTFRGQDGLWRNTDPSALFTPEMLAEQPETVWEMYDELRGRMAAAEPNAGHHALAELARGRSVTLATQNIDGLHQRAGSEDVLELHGCMWRIRCDRCRRSEEDARVPLPELPPRCPRCGAILRPDIVLFTEMLPALALSRAWDAAAQCDLMLVVGTSGVVYPAAALPGIASENGALVVEVNPQPTVLSAGVERVVRAPAAEALPWMVEVLLAHAEAV